MSAPTGEQHELRSESPAGELRAIVTELGASLRLVSVGDVEIVQSYAEDAPTPSCAGVVLVPWPNRIPDGRWDDGGVERQLAITEPPKNNAIHGLLRYSPYTVAAHSDASVTLEAPVFPQLGYPYHLDTSVTYELVDDGITVTHTLRNLGEGEAPVAVGTHPFLTIGDLSAADLTVRVAADTHIDVDERLNPTGTTAVNGTRFDLREGVKVGAVDLDDAWADVHIVDGRSSHSITADDGRSVAMWADEHFGYVQVYNTDAFPGQDGAVWAVAVEPMTGPANSFNSGAGLHRLAPGASWTVRWGIRFSGFPTQAS
ncbi:aldose epimerase [Glaciibacter flavus]|uniref:Aldose epimerase n=1 Tax=Orlajensenia flava TaxID=2565934 RepID=A0A4S4FYS4_9MICO|nr:aldose 1-epimerase family protein [Glaciibacter flavus]THG35784.1 aldose epimerase [Glaciibacter flavus]